jgi:hypothetical protein
MPTVRKSRNQDWSIKPVHWYRLTSTIRNALVLAVQTKQDQIELLDIQARLMGGVSSSHQEQASYGMTNISPWPYKSRLPVGLQCAEW